jgi:hypothetical protein
MGYPLGLRGSEHNYAIIRQGIISRVDEEVLREHFFYIDASTYPWE